MPQKTACEMILRCAVSHRDNPIAFSSARGSQESIPDRSFNHLDHSCFHIMSSGDFSNLPNPFAPEPAEPRNDRRNSAARRSLMTSLKLLVLVATVFAVFVVVTTQGPDWLANRLASDFDQLDVASKQARLKQFSELGISGIPPLTIALADPETEVAQTAHQLIGRLQNQWTAESKEQAEACRERLADCLTQVDQHLDGERKTWVADLIGKAVEQAENTEVPKQTDELVATRTSTPSSAVSSSAVLLPPQLAPMPTPILEAPEEQLFSGSDWPPSRIAQVGFVAEKKATAETNLDFASIRSNSVDENFASDANVSQPTIYAVARDEPQANSLRSDGNNLHKIAREKAVALQDVREPSGHIEMAPPEIAHSNASQPDLSVQLQAGDVTSVIAVLGSSDIASRSLAQSELTNRGFDEYRLQIATLIASGTVDQRIELIGHLVESDSMDPRPWLLLLLDDQNRSVKMEAVIALAKTLDPDVRQALRSHLAGEPDQAVALQIRDVLNLR